VWAHERITLTAHSGTPMEPRPLLAGSTRRARAARSRANRWRTRAEVSQVAVKGRAGRGRLLLREEGAPADRPRRSSSDNHAGRTCSGARFAAAL